MPRRRVERREKVELTPAQVRAARALLRWTQAQLAQHTELFIGTVKEFEHERSNPMSSTLLALERVLREAGVVFVDAGDGMGAGVRFRSRNR